MAASAVSSLIQVLRPLVQDEVGLLWGVDKELKRLSSILSTVLAVLDDAELQQFQQAAIQDWLRKLQDAAYEAREILEDCETEASRWKRDGRIRGTLRKVWTLYPVQNLLFRHSIGNRIKDILEDLDSIAQERIKFHFTERTPENLIQFDERRETSSALPHLEVFGRQVDKDYIVKALTVDLCGIKEVSVLPIIGMGGLGKTTLAQLVTNDKRIKHHFEPIIWVYVSPDFSVKRVMKLIIEYVSGKVFEGSSLDSLQRQVREVLSGKRYLLVLDDVWSEDEEEWNKLKFALSSGLHGSYILVTTRSEEVTSMVSTHLTFRVSVLSEDDCWLLFRQRVFGSDREESQDLVAIGREIVKKCSGVPLAAKALGGLMRSKIGVKEWVNIKESNLWDLPQGQFSILPALRLSYYNLPLELRHCFSYCAVFPKGSRMEKDKLIQLWMANGFISSRGRLELEDVGNEVWNELYRRSLFLKDEKDPEKMFMHDLVHDLARSIIGYECCTMETESSSIISEHKIRHATLVGRHHLASVFSKALKEQNKLQSILLQGRGLSFFDEFDFSCNFKHFGSLRVFDGNGAYMLKLSGSIGNSKHLTYLNLSRTPIEKLPTSICSLHHLQTLNLDDCGELEWLPKKMHRLTSLRHLYMRRCHKIKNTPPKLGKLTQLKTLSKFVVGKSDGRHISELKHLDLGGELDLKHLERVSNSMEAKEANLDGKLNLCVLSLEWDGKISENTVEGQEVIEALRPHPNIKELTIRYYRGKEMPLWMSDPSILRNVVRIAFFECRNCLRLPALWNLPCLKHLSVEGSMTSTPMVKMEYMFENGNNDNLSGGGGGSNVTSSSAAAMFVAFPSLEEIVIRSLPNLKGLLTNEEEDEEGTVKQQQLLFPRLGKMNIQKCPQLALLPTLPALKELEIEEIGSVTFLASISKLSSLTSLDLERNEDMVSLPEEMLQNLTLLQSLSIKSFIALEVLPESMSRLSSLTSLYLSNNKGMVIFADVLQNLHLLQSLEISDVKSLKVLPENMSSLSSLVRMKIQHFPQMALLPALPALKELEIFDSSSVTFLASIFKLTSLTSLSLDGNDDLVSLPEEMLQNLSLLQSLCISSFRALKVLPDTMSRLGALKKLKVKFCYELECLPDHGIASLSSLTELSIVVCPKMVSLPDSIQTLTQLQTLDIFFCSQELKMRCEKGKGQEWFKIKHIPYIRVRSRIAAARYLLYSATYNRVAIAEAGVIPIAKGLISEIDSRTHEHAVATLLNLSICEENKGRIMSCILE